MLHGERVMHLYIHAHRMPEDVIPEFEALNG